MTTQTAPTPEMIDDMTSGLAEGLLAGVREELQSRVPTGSRLDIWVTTRTGRAWGLLWKSSMVLAALIALVNIENRTPRHVGEGCPTADGPAQLWSQDPATPAALGCETVRRW